MVRTMLGSAGSVATRLCLAIAGSCFLTETAAAQKRPQVTTTRDISDLDLEELLKIRVTSAANKEQPLSKVGAGLFVITREDIASSGANSIPDLLRLVPGVEVAQINSNQWAISIRGFNSLYSNKVLALIDGRAVYEPTFSGVLWDQQDLPLEDIERIEVIRGPGGTIWGANAMNGVINIITRHARETRGGLVTAGGGSWRAGEGLAQYGGDAGSRGVYRAFAKYFDVSSSVSPAGQRAVDGWHSWAGGFRSDWDLSPHDTLTVQGDLRSTVAGGMSLATYSEPQPYQAVMNSPIRNALGNVMGTWRHTLAGGSETTLRVYYDRIQRDGEAGVDVTRDSFHASFTHHVALGARHDFVWGLEARMDRDAIRPYDSHSLSLVPARKTVPFASGFFQDEIRLRNDLFLTLGSKLEHNGYTGFEYEPGIQLVWIPTDHHTLWASASRAIRQPNRTDFGSRFNVGLSSFAGMPALVTFAGTTNAHTEQLYDFEAGYRSRPHARLELDLTAFLSHYDNLQTSEPGAPYVVTNPARPPYVVLPMTFANLAEGRNYGAELFAKWAPVRRWTLSPGYSFLQMSVERRPGSLDAITASASGNSAKHHFQLRSLIKLPANVEWSATARYVSSLAGLNVPSYLAADTTLRWRPRDDLEVGLTGENLLSPGHAEFIDRANVIFPSLAKRSVFLKLTCRF